MSEDEFEPGLREWFLGDGMAPTRFMPGIHSRRRKIVVPEVTTAMLDDAGTDYIKMYKEEDARVALEAAEVGKRFSEVRIKGIGMSQLEGSTTIAGEFTAAVDMELLQSKQAAYTFDFSNGNTKTSALGFKSLGIDKMRNKILDALRMESALIIKGRTGCGKSTRVPQFILDDYQARGVPCNIVVTQPRRIAAVSIARRVCEERMWQLGTVVGYQIGMERKLEPYTCLTYMTTGCLLEMMVGKKSLAGYTHIIVDEVHERDADTDLLMLVLRKFMRESHTGTKIIFMSATVEPRKFSDYLELPVNGVLKPARIIDVDLDAHHPVNVYYLDDLRNLSYLNSSIGEEPTEPGIGDSYYEVVARLISAFDGNREVARFGRNRDHQHLSGCRGSVLVFLPGVFEIENMRNVLLSHDEHATKKNLWEILPLHSRITSEEQNRIFRKPTENYRKIILATNIAESSITVPDIIYVVDFCLIKQLTADPDTNFCSLKMEWAPRNNCEQRKGRVGRCNEGVVYRMISRNVYFWQLAEDITPEILRCPLEQTVLRTKLLDLGEPKRILALALDPPDLANIVKTIFTLKEVGAMKITTKGVINHHDGDLSYLGRVVAKLPIDVRLGRLVMLGYIFNVMDECIVMAAGLASKNIFTSSFDEKLRAYQVKMLWGEGCFSDPLTIMRAYSRWTTCHHEQQFKRSGQSMADREAAWAKSNFIQLRAIKEMDCLVKDIRVRLKSMGIESPTGPNIRPLSDSDRGLVLRVVIFGAFYPQYFYRSAEGMIDEREAVKSLCGLDPLTTVRLRDFPRTLNHRAHYKQIKNNLKDIFKLVSEDTWNADITIDETRVFVTFHQGGNPSRKKRIPSRVALPVYLAIKQRQLQNSKMKPRYYFKIDQLDQDESDQYLKTVDETSKILLSPAQLGAVELAQDWYLPAARLPASADELVLVTVSHVEDPSRFWVQRVRDQEKHDYQRIAAIVGAQGCNLVEGGVDSASIRKNSLVMGPYDGEYYRAKILARQTTSSDKKMDFKVKLYFIDYGNAAEVLASELKKMPPELFHFPPLAMQCTLTGVMPSPMNDMMGLWESAAVLHFKEQFLDERARAKVFSVVNRVISCDLIPLGRKASDSFCQEMIDRNWAVPVEESYCSKADNELRVAARVDGNCYLEREGNRNVQKLRAEIAAIENFELPTRMFARDVYLKGPESPLEMRLYGKVRSLSGCVMHVENDSVNSVLLDDHPQDKHERILIAAQVGKSSNNNTIHARNTTMLPNIYGLPALLTLLFAPRAEYRCDTGRTRLTGAVCGLGFDKKKRCSIYPEHDMEIEFDAEFHMGDALLINKLRFWMNAVLGMSSENDFQNAPSTERIMEVSTKLLQLLFELVKTQRGEVDIVRADKPYAWNQMDPRNILHSDSEENRLLELIPFHNCVRLNKPNHAD